MIPKKIHYCWFGGNPLPELAQKCIASWKKYCPDYEIIEWNENNFDIHCCKYVEEAYNAKKWAFVSDVARLYALVNYGGIYMDTDVELLNSLDPFLNYEAFSGFEAMDRIPTGLMASEKGQVFFKELLDEYKSEYFIKNNGEYDLTTNVERITKQALKYGLKLNNEKQTIKGFTLFPNDYFCPKNLQTLELVITQNTIAIHHFDGSWLPDEDKLAKELFKKYNKFLPKKIARKYAKFKAVKQLKGFKQAIKEMSEWIFRKRNK